jgi:NitT/TauT family transport system permease protein
MRRASAIARSATFPFVLGGGTFVAFLIILELAISFGAFNRFVVPLPTDVIAALPRVVIEEGAPSRFMLTLGEASAAGILVAIVGISIGALLHRFDLLREATETWVAAAASAPTVLLYPLFLVIFGRNTATIIAMGFVAGLAPIILKTLEGLCATRGVLINVGRSFNLTPSQQFWKILFPAALPTIFVGLRIGLIFTMLNIVGVEFLINFGGLGQLINEMADRYDVPGTYAAILFVVLISVLMFIVIERLERWLRPKS